MKALSYIDMHMEEGKGEKYFEKEVELQFFPTQNMTFKLGYHSRKWETPGDTFWATVTAVAFHLDENKLKVGLKYRENEYDEDFFLNNGWVEWYKS